MDVHAHLLETYDRAAPTYDSAGIAHFTPFGERLAQMVLLGPGGRVLDVACGSGAALLPAARRVGPSGTALGVDLSPRMVARTRIAAKEAGLEHVRAEVMDAAALDLADGDFDAVLCAFGLSAVPDADTVVAGMRRALTPRGMIGVSVFANLFDVRWTWETDLLQELAADVPAELLEAVGAMSSRFDEPEKLAAGLEAAGFGDVAIERMEVEFTFPSAEAWWDWTWSYGFRAFLEALPEASRERLRDAGFERLEGAGRRGRSRSFVALLATARPAE